MLGDELHKARLAGGMTQEQLSIAANIDRPYISLLENNKRSPTVDTLFRLCDALGVQPSRLIAKVEKARPARRSTTRRSRKP